jgi:hypothetical protein
MSRRVPSPEEHPVTLTLDHAYGIQMENDASGNGWGGRPGLHGGARTDQGEQ